jgi:hypothetical protein
MRNKFHQARTRNTEIVVQAQQAHLQHVENLATQAGESAYAAHEHVRNVDQRLHHQGQGLVDAHQRLRHQGRGIVDAHQRLRHQGRGIDDARALGRQGVDLARDADRRAADAGLLVQGQEAMRREAEDRAGAERDALRGLVQGQEAARCEAEARADAERGALQGLVQDQEAARREAEAHAVAERGALQGAAQGARVEAGAVGDRLDMVTRDLATFKVTVAHAICGAM